MSKQRGQYVVMTLPSARFGVFWIAAAQPTVFHLVADFPSQVRAELYCDTENCMEESADGWEPEELPALETSEPPESNLKLLQQKPFSRGERKSLIDAVVAELKTDLPSLWAERHNRVTPQTLMLHYGVKYDDACAIANEAARRGIALWMQLEKYPPHHALVPLDTPPPKFKQISDRVHDVWLAMWAHRDANNCIESRLQDISKWAGCPLGTLGTVIAKLVDLGHIMVARPAIRGRDARPTVYQILKDPEVTS